MKDLESLFKDSSTQFGDPLCEGCTILKKQKPCHSVMDYETIDKADVLFLSDSLKFRHGSPLPFDALETKPIRHAYNGPAAFAASVARPLSDVVSPVG